MCYWPSSMRWRWLIKVIPYRNAEMPAGVINYQWLNISSSFSYLFTLTHLSESVAMTCPSLTLELTGCCTYVAFQFLLIVFAFIGCLNTGASWRHVVTGWASARWGAMAEWHGEKNLQVSRARSWGFMARFTPSAMLQAGGGFVNPLLNAKWRQDFPPVFFSPRKLAWRKSGEPLLLTSVLHQEVTRLPGAQGN